MSNPSAKQINSLCSSFYSFIPNKKHDFHQLKIPFIICLSPFNEKSENQVKNYKYSYHYVPKCYHCNSVSFPTVSKNKQYNKHSFWVCPICHKENIYKLSYLKIYSYFDHESKAIDFYYSQTPKPKLVEPQPIFSYQNKSFLFVLELTTSTQNHQFFHEALLCIKKELENKNEGEISIFIVNSHLHFPVIRKNDVVLTTTYEIIDNEFPPFQKMFFDLSSQKKLLFEFIDFIDSSVANKTIEQSGVTEISLFDILQSIVKLIRNKNIKCIFLVSQIVKDNENHSIYKSYKEFIFSNIKSILPFDFFLIENMYSNHNFDVLRESFFISNGFINFYNNNSSQISFFSNDFCDRINHIQYSRIGISAIIPPSLKINDIHGCGIRASDNDFSLKTMDKSDSIYYFVDFSSSEIPNGEPLNFQFQVIYHDYNNEPRIRIIDFQLIAYDGLEIETSKVNCDVLISGCMNHAIDIAREEEKINKAVDTMKDFEHDFNSDKNAKFFFQHQNQSQPFQINWFQNILNTSLNSLYLPLFWPLILGKYPTDIQLLLSPLLYKINLDGFDVIGPSMISNKNFETGIYFIVLQRNRGALFALCKEEDTKTLSLILDIKNNLELKEKIQKLFPESTMTIIDNPIQSINDLKKYVIILQ